MLSEVDLLERNSFSAQVAGLGIFVIDRIHLCQEEQRQATEARGGGIGLVYGNGKSNHFGAVRFDKGAQFRQAAAGTEDVVDQHDLLTLWRVR